MEHAKIILTVLWWAWGLSLFVLLASLSQPPLLMGADVRAAWEWFLPHVLPTMSLVGATAYATRAKGGRKAPAGATPFLLALAASCAHLSALTIALAGTLSSTAPLESLRTANLWLAPLQALATSSLAIFFIRR